MAYILIVIITIVALIMTIAVGLSKQNQEESSTYSKTSNQRINSFLWIYLVTMIMLAIAFIIYAAVYL